jgi:hypothetical protein
MLDTSLEEEETGGAPNKEEEDGAWLIGGSK